MDSTVRSNLTVGPPIEVKAAYERIARNKPPLPLRSRQRLPERLKVRLIIV